MFFRISRSIVIHKGRGNPIVTCFQVGDIDVEATGFFREPLSVSSAHQLIVCRIRARHDIILAGLADGWSEAFASHSLAAIRTEASAQE